MPIAILALSLNSAGFLTEIIAGALRNVPLEKSRQRAPSD
jgi:ABC-type arginine/histidine transport system permease subunit